jgi:hypothetical protein
MYLMRIQELDSNKVTVVKAEGKLSTIISQLALLNIHVIGYCRFDDGDDVVVTKY